MGLIDASALSGETCSYDENRSAQNGDRSGAGRPPVGAWPGGGRGALIGESPSAATASSDDRESARETHNKGRVNGAAPYVQTERVS